MLIKEDYKNSKKVLAGDIEKIKVIRDAIAHHKFEIDSQGYKFKDDKKEVILDFKEFVDFIHRIENDFYVEKNRNSEKFHNIRKID